MPDSRPQLEVVSPVPLDERGFLAADLPCLGCGYNLRGLAPPGNCPECNASIALSLRGDALCFAPVEWLKRIRSGLLLLIIATAGVPALITCFFFLIPFEHAQTCAFVAGFLLLECIGARGVFIATSAGAAGFTAPLAASSARGRARMAAVVHTIAALIFSVSVSMELGGARATDLVVWGPLSLFFATFGFVSVSFLQHLTTLLRRTRSVDLARAVTGVALAMGIAAGLVSCAGILAVCFGASDSNPGFCVFWLGGLVGALSFVALFVVLILSRRALAFELRLRAA